MTTTASSIAEGLLLDFDHEIRSTQRVLERIPETDPKWKPHEKSMPIGRLAIHVARLPDFWKTIISTPELNLDTYKFPDLAFESTAQLLSELDRAAREAKAATLAASDDEFKRDWKLIFHGQTLVEAPRMVLYRTMFLNHVIHHRGQLTVYLRLLNIPVPGLYGPSADESFG